MRNESHLKIPNRLGKVKSFRMEFPILSRNMCIKTLKLSNSNSNEISSCLHTHPNQILMSYLHENWRKHTIVIHRAVYQNNNGKTLIPHDGRCKIGQCISTQFGSTIKKYKTWSTTVPAVTVLHYINQNSSES